MGRRNLTLQLDENVIRRAKIVAARKGTSVSGLVSRELEQMIERDARYEEARRRALDVLAATTARGDRRWRREDLYER